MTLPGVFKCTEFQRILDWQKIIKTEWQLSIIMTPNVSLSWIYWNECNFVIVQLKTVSNHWCPTQLSLIYFLNFSHLMEHIRAVHFKIKNHVCLFCDWKFNRIVSLSYLEKYNTYYFVTLFIHFILDFKANCSIPLLFLLHLVCITWWTATEQLYHIRKQIDDVNLIRYHRRVTVRLL